MNILTNCNREWLSPDSNALPEFSTDTVNFDTVFTTIGSATLNFKIYNPSNRPLVISSIELAEGENSFFRLNIDGVPSVRVTHIEIPPDDSLFVFVAVTIDPTNSNNPIVIKDSVVFNTNGNIQDVKLLAYGQDVHLIKGLVIETETWINDKPYLIYNSMAVDSGFTLTINAGTKIYFHKNSSMIILGTIQVNGTWENPVVFRNDRLEAYYDIIAGQWGTIYIDPMSKGNKINHAIIKNAIAGIQIGYPTDYSVPDLVISNTMIMNASFAGIYAFGADLTCYNTVLADCAGACAALLRGGRYKFLHCSVSNNGVYGSPRTDPAIVLSNVFNNPEYDEISGKYEYVARSGDLEEALFSNCIIYGNLNHELLYINNNVNAFNFRFEHCLIRADENSLDFEDTGHYLSLILNKDPHFVNDSDRYHLNFRLDTLSPAKDAGEESITVTYPFLVNDITETVRTLHGKPDLGAFERKEY